jgi:hypothetical protein
MSPERILVYRFFELPHIVRLEIARELGLWSDEDDKMCWESKEIFDLIFERASGSVNVLADLWDSVEEWHDDGEYPTNLFREKR